MTQKNENENSRSAIVAEAQKLIDELKTYPEFSQYVKEHKLSLIDSRLSVYDQFLNRGLITA